MSQAHRPTWNPTQGRETKSGSQQVSKHALAAYTKLKFRQPGQTSTSDVIRRDLRADLLAAERLAAEKKRKASGIEEPVTVSTNLRISQGDSSPSTRLRIPTDGQDRVDKEGEDDDEDEERNKRRKVLEQAAELDKDDSDDESKDEPEEDDDSEESDSDDEDETAALMAELESIKRERAAEKARQEAESSAKQTASREAEIATGNPLLNLQAALGQTPSTPGSTTTTFAVKRRWDDDVIFKNQAAGVSDKPKKGEFVNDLLRSEFHKKFMLKWVFFLLSFFAQTDK
ncbi:protein CWC15 [Tremella mesenterica]|uniref:Protein CWC15 n=1 Tax=Tremella mesenterica TaxID=5217 RepID=A0A4Q1BAF3_TREME|nr:protein CWC15 [Tremella mesenterica]